MLNNHSNLCKEANLAKCLTRPWMREWTSSFPSLIADEKLFAPFWPIVIRYVWTIVSSWKSGSTNCSLELSRKLFASTSMSDESEAGYSGEWMGVELTESKSWLSNDNISSSRSGALPVEQGFNGGSLGLANKWRFSVGTISSDRISNCFRFWCIGRCWAKGFEFVDLKISSNLEVVGWFKARLSWARINSSNLEGSRSLSMKRALELSFDWNWDEEDIVGWHPRLYLGTTIASNGFDVPGESSRIGTNSSNLGSSLGKDGIIMGMICLVDSFWAKFSKMSSTKGSGLGDCWIELIRSSSSSLGLRSPKSWPSSMGSTDSARWNAIKWKVRFFFNLKK